MPYIDYYLPTFYDVSFKNDLSLSIFLQIKKSAIYGTVLTWRHHLFGRKCKKLRKNDDAKKSLTGGREFKKSGKSDVVILGSFKNFKLVDTTLQFCLFNMILGQKQQNNFNYIINDIKIWIKYYLALINCLVH